MELGFIGLGIMGNPMLTNLLQHDLSVTAFDVQKESLNKVVEKGAIAAKSPANVAKDSDIIFLVLPNAAIVEDVLFGENGISQSVKANSIIVDLSSIAPKDSIRFSNQLKEQGVDYLDAPISGGEPKAIDGTLAIMVGGEKLALDKVIDYLKIMGENITHVGDSGSGSATKLANQIIVNVTIAAVSEATLLSAKAGVDIGKMYQAIRTGLAGSAVLDAKLPLVLERDFVAGGRIDINLKDLQNVYDTGELLDVPLPLTTNVIEMFKDLYADGKEANDHISLIEYYEKQANFKV